LIDFFKVLTGLGTVGDDNSAHTNFTGCLILVVDFNLDKTRRFRHGKVEAVKAEVFVLVLASEVLGMV